MARVRLSYSGTNIDFGPGEGFERPKIPDRARHRAGDGSLYSYDFYTPKKKWVVPITDMTKGNAETNINSWWENDKTCTFYPDYTNTPAVSYLVKIVNPDSPMWFYILSNWGSHYSGTLILEET